MAAQLQDPRVRLLSRAIPSTRSQRKLLVIGLATACVVVAGLLIAPAGGATDQTPEKIAFFSTRDGNPEIYVMNADGTGQTRLTSNSSADAYPSLSPDGTKIAFASNRDGNYEIYVMNADGTGQTRLTNDASRDGEPTFSPDGTKIAFTRQVIGTNPRDEIYIMNANGSGLTQLTQSSDVASDLSPSFSPDGTKIAFASIRDGNWEIYVMGADGSGQTRLTSNAGNDVEPSFSPDGTKIAFASNRDGNYEIYVVNADGTGQTRLTDSASYDAHPTFSLDGTRIAFTSDRNGWTTRDIYVMNAADGSDPTNYTSNSSSDEWPSFGGGSESIDFDWTVPERFGADGDGDGLFDYFAPSGSLEIEPAMWQVDFTVGDPASSCDESLTREWSVDGSQVDSTESCAFSYDFPAEGVYSVELRIEDADGVEIGSVTKDVTVQDWLIVSVGDSIASGEGVPDIPGLAGIGFAWQDQKCHRSALAGPAQAAMSLEAADDKTSVTFIHLACSGATVNAGLLGPYEGIEPRSGSVRRLPPQVEEMTRLVGGRELDALLVSIGANDVEFADALTTCAARRDCHLGAARRKFERLLRLLPGKYLTVSVDLEQRGVPGARTYITEYPDPMHDDDGSFCDGILGGISASEAQWASETMLPSLNAEVAKAGPDWRYVSGIFDAFRFDASQKGHGYCAEGRWVVQLSESVSNQADEFGTIHPNILGHSRYGQQIAASVAADLYTGGDLGSPRPPAEAAG